LLPSVSGPLRVIVTLVEQLGALSLVHGELAGKTEIIAQVAASDAFRLDECIGLALDTAHCHVFDGEGRTLKRLDHALDADDRT
jgi:ABC-type sugar transport system ATPase subunit